MCNRTQSLLLSYVVSAVAFQFPDEKIETLECSGSDLAWQDSSV